MTAKGKSQVFQSAKPTRWIRVRWVFRVVAVVLLMVITGVVASLFIQGSVRIPDHGARNLSKLSIKEISASFSPLVQREFVKDIDAVRRKPHRDLYSKEVADPQTRGLKLPLRAAFYVNWDVQSGWSLKKNISKLNMVLPEWLFVADTSDRIAVNIDSTGLDIMRRQKVAIVPMISNYFNQQWNGANLHRLLTSEKRRRVFISSVLAMLERYHFQGVNIDFEEMTETTDEYLILFMKELSGSLHRKGFIVTQDISPFNEDYNIPELAKYNDYLFLMGYDQHNANSLPGPVGTIKWVEAALDDICGKTESEKVILCIPAYGYDWPVGYHGEDITYQEAVTRAAEQGGKITYDNNNYNLTYNYTDDGQVKHVVWFADACTDFNVIRASEDFGTAGVALWRLGSEDSRVWDFFDRPLNLDSLRKTPFHPSGLEHVAATYNVDYIGAGEVLDIKSSPSDGLIKIEMDTAEQLVAEQQYITLPTSYVIQKTGETAKQIAITFDDGPDPGYTPEILDILKEFNIKATFFVTGINCEQNVMLLRRTYEEGHEIGNHTFTHPNLELSSDERMKLELRSTNLMISSITGHGTIYFRPPFNTDAEPRNFDQIHPIKVAKDEGFITVGSSIDPRDWEKGISADTIYRRAVEQQNLGNILLLHDAGGDRTETVKALPRIIQYYRRQGYRFVTVSQLIGLARGKVMPSSGERYLSVFDDVFIFGGYYVQLFLYGLFFAALILTMGKTIINGILAIYSFILQKRNYNPAIINAGMVTIIVPAYNEEKNILKTINNLLGSDYPDLEIIVSDDGSVDGTPELVRRNFSDEAKVRLLTRPNGGKASALQAGIALSSGEILVCIDADTLLDPAAITRLVRYFADPRVAAVAGNVKVGNVHNMLTSWQSIEYTTSQNFDRRAFEILNAIMVVPGAIGAFRKDAVNRAGGFTTDTLAEDCDLTLRLIRGGNSVKNCSTALAYTEAPETLKMFLRQRFRWTFGIMQSFWKHRDLLFSRKQPNLGWVILPNILIFQMLLPLFAPIVDVMLLFSLFVTHSGTLLVSYLIYLQFDAAVAWIAHYFDKEKFGIVKLLSLAVQRLVYRWLMWYVLVKAYVRAVKGELTQWGVLKRTGNVRFSEQNS
ncbi:MAG: glycosyltransferase [Bacteroidota bacterium]